ncbi:MAG: GNAT family N-acetyltransferase [Candidatus Eisenbacteria bacterium]
MTEPFVAWEDGEAVGHVGVLEHRIRLDGRDVLCAGVHAVATRSDRRGRGIARRLLTEALHWVDRRYGLCKLTTDVPAVYAPHGFRTVPLHRFLVLEAAPSQRHSSRPSGDASESVGAQARPGAGPSPRMLDLLCSVRDPASDRLSSLDPGWLAGIDLALQGRVSRDLTGIPGLGAFVDWTVRDGALEIHDVIAPSLPTLPELLAAAPPHERVELHMAPDRLAPDAVPIPQPEVGVLMVRGEWPFGDDVPLAVSRLGEH